MKEHSCDTSSIRSESLCLLHFTYAYDRNFCVKKSFRCRCIEPMDMNPIQTEKVPFYFIICIVQKICKKCRVHVD